MKIKLQLNELMVEDWVLCNNTYFRIVAIEKRDKYISIGIEDITGAYDIVDINALSPIPLTSELLSKIGFIEEPHERMSIWRLGDFSIECTFTDWTFYWCNGGIELNYLHELQNVLNICDIEKTICI